MNRIFFVPLVILLSFTIVNACILPDRVEFYYPIDVEDLKISLEFDKKQFEVLNDTILIYYDDSVLSVSKHSLIFTCKEVGTECIEKSTFRSVLEDVEEWNGFDLSKEEKDVIAGLYQSNVVIKRLDKTELLYVKLKLAFMKLLGRFFCANYEKVLTCSGEWCSLEVLKSEKCLYFVERCG